MEIDQKDFESFKNELMELVNNRLDEFIEEFVSAACQDPEKTEENNHTEDCDCEKCTEENPEDGESPARYVLFSGGQKYFATDVKPNAFAGIDFYLHEVDPKSGKEYNSKGTITSADVVIVDLKPDMTLETFSAIKQQTLDYVIQKAEEAKASENAENKKMVVNRDCISTVNSYG